MNKKVKVALLVGIPIIIGSYFIYRQFRKPTTKPRNLQEKKDVITEITQTPVTPKPDKCNFPLVKGTYNCDLVEKLQKALNSFPNDFVNYPLVEDGDFGAKTEAALSDVTYQMYNFKDKNSGYKEVYDQGIFNKILGDIDKELDNAIAEENKRIAEENPYVSGQFPPQPSFPIFPTL